jgi:hypothetical protein
MFTIAKVKTFNMMKMPVVLGKYASLYLEGAYLEICLVPYLSSKEKRRSSGYADASFHAISYSSNGTMHINTELVEPRMQQPVIR